MALWLQDKKAIVEEVASVASGAVSAVVAEYRGLTVGEMTELRVKARADGVYLRVVRNTLARRAVAGTAFVCLQDSFVGPVVLAFSSGEPGTAARLFRDFQKNHQALVVKVLSVAGALVDAGQLEAVASLPTKEEALAKLMAVMKAPIEKFVRTLAAPQIKLVRTLVAVRDQKGGITI